MGKATAFERELDNLWRRRSDELRSLVISTRGRPKTFSRDRREKALSRLLDLASVLRPRDLAKRKVAEYERTSLQLKRRGVRRGSDLRFDRLREWVSRRLGRKSIVYVFLRGRRCIYVGQGRSARRLLAYRNSTHFRDARKVVVYVVPKPQLDLAECLAMHLYNPAGNRVSGRRKGRRKCPVCRAERQIRNEIRTIFVA